MAVQVRLTSRLAQKPHMSCLGPMETSHYLSQFFVKLALNMCGSILTKFLTI